MKWKFFFFQLYLDFITEKFFYSDTKLIVSKAVVKKILNPKKS